MAHILELDKAAARTEGEVAPTAVDPKVTLRAMAEAAKKRKAEQINDDEALYASSVVKKSARSARSAVKTKTTLTLGKGKAEITTETKRVPAKKEGPASPKKLSASAKKLLLA